MNYRSRISLKMNSKGELGYFKPKSHQHVPISQCAIAHTAINQVLEQLPPVPFANKGIEFRSDGSKVLLNIFSAKGQRPRKKQLEDWAGDIVAGIGMDSQSMIGEKYSSITVCGVEHHFSLGAFYQVNLEINELLVSQIVSWVEEHAPSKVLDLYSGAGNIGLAIANKGIPVLGIESNPHAVQDGKRTALRLNLDMEFRKGNADRFQAGDAFFNLAVLDPPRKGAQSVFKELALTRPMALIYVSCNPHALRKDLVEARKQGYLPRRMIAFDMFPHTSHVETLVELIRE